MFFVLVILKNFFINSIKHVFFPIFENKNCFQEFNSQMQIFLYSKNTKNYFSE